MRIGVIDVGSNTTRLLVADAAADDLAPLEKAKVRLGLGEEIERYGAVSAVHLAAAAKAVRGMAAAARLARVVSLDVFLTAPGRQADNAEELVAALTRAAGVQARVLTKEEEGTLAYRGAILTAGVPLPSRIAVCDIGGASTEIAVGSPGSEPHWIESVDLGSVRLSTRGGDMRAEARRARPDRASGGRDRTRSRRQRAGSETARRIGARRGRAGRGDAARGDELAPRDRRLLRRRPGSRRDPARRRHPARRGAAEAGSPAARLHRRDPRGSRARLARGARGLGRGNLAHDLSVAQHHRRALLQAAAHQRLDDVAVRAADHAVLVQQLARAAACALGEPIVLLQRHTELGRQRLDGLDTTDVGARDHTANAERAQQLDELDRLAATTVIERPREVVAVPAGAVPRRRVTEKDACHSSSSSGRSRPQLSSRAAPSGSSQRMSSTSSWGANSPSSARMRQ